MLLLACIIGVIYVSWRGFVFVFVFVGFRYGFGEEARDDGCYEEAHITFPLLRAVDVLVETAPGDTPPPLGQVFALREGAPLERLKAGYTYTFSFYSGFVDFARWQVCNVPGYSTIDLNNFLGIHNHVRVVGYSVVENSTGARPSPRPPHWVRDKRYFFKFDVSQKSLNSSVPPPGG